MNIGEKILYIFIDFPCNILRNLTIPMFERKRYNKTLYLLHPVFSVSFFLFTTGKINFFIQNKTYGLILFVLIISITVLINFASPEDGPPPYPMVFFYLKKDCLQHLLCNVYDMDLVYFSNFNGCFRRIIFLMISLLVKFSMSQLLFWG